MLLKSFYFWRTYIGYVLVALIGTFLFAMSLVGRFEKQIEEKADSTLLYNAQLLSQVLVAPLQNLNYPQVREMAESVAQNADLRVTVIDNNGVVLSDNFENPFTMDNHLRRPEILLASSAGIGRASRYSFTLEEQFNYLAVPMLLQDQIVGFVRTARASTAMQAEISEANSVLLRNAAIATFFVLLLAFYLSARQAMKVLELTAMAEEISRGNFSRRIPVENALGLKKLAQAINKMARSSAQSVTEITTDRNRLATVFTCMVEGVVDVDMDQNILHINEAAVRMLSINEKDSLGKPLWLEIRNQEIISALDKAIKTSSVIKTQTRLDHELVQRVVDIYAASLSDDQGEPIGAVLVLHDITDLKNLERVRTDFVANASHELKTPITAIRGLTETIIDDDQVDKETMVHFLKRVHAQSLRLSQLVGDLMTISRLESSDSREDFTKINFADLIRRALRAALSTAEQKGHTLVADLPEKDIELYGDRQNLSQLLDNLIDNAMKYTTESGTINITLKVEGQTALLEVTDSGIGISPQHQKRVFERFYRVDKARSQSLGGTGLGLSIVKNIVEKHGGTVSVRSQLGSGSTFIIRLPMDNAGTEQAQAGK